jgi:CBS domain containing-hemolysin-like protein
VGEIWDEHDEVLSEITEISPNVYKVLGSVSINDMCEYFDVSEIESDSSTVGGWVIDMLGKVPCVGDQLTYENLHITVSETEFRRITQLKVEVLPKEEEE